MERNKSRQHKLTLVLTALSCLAIGRRRFISACAVMMGLLLWSNADCWAGPISVTPTMNGQDLMDALPVSGGLTVTSVTALNGAEGQFGTYTDFTTQPITIGNGVVLSSGNVGFMAAPADPILDFPQPSYDMNTLGTSEFDAYGPGHIENFNNSNDVAVLRVDFTLDDDSQIMFDFVFGSVEYPYWTSSYTDSFLVFLDGFDAANQITFDANSNPVQVGVSFSGLVSIADQNTAFADPHGVLGLTTTTAVLSGDNHTLYFEIGDVNDHILDSAVFISNLRTGVGDEGTELTDPEDPLVPEPGAMTLWVIALGALEVFRRARRRTTQVRC